MRKRDLEKQRSEFRGNTSLDTDSLRSQVAQELGLVKNAHDIADTALLELEKQFTLIDSPKDLAHLAKAYRDIASTIVALRAEARLTIADVQGRGASQNTPEARESADPPISSGVSERGGAAPPAKISPPARGPALPTPRIHTEPVPLSTLLGSDEGPGDSHG